MSQPPLLSRYARRRKLAWVQRYVPPDWRILEVGSGDGWIGKQLKNNGYEFYTNIDPCHSADIRGDVRKWPELGLQPNSFDAILAFELIEHVDCLEDLFSLLRPGGLLLMTSPYPGTDWICWLLEQFGLSQKRTSPHNNLLNFHKLPLFDPVAVHRVGLLAQWGVFRKPTAPAQPA